MDNTTLTTLDWPTVLDAFAECAYTTLGAHAIHNLDPLDSVHAVQLAFDQIDELIALELEGERIPVGGIEDISELLKRSAKGEVLDGLELRQAGQTLGALRSLSWFLTSRQEEMPHLGQLGTLIVVDDLVADELDVAFEPNGTLSGRTYPILAELRSKVSGLHDAIRSTLDSRYAQTTCKICFKTASSRSVMNDTSCPLNLMRNDGTSESFTAHPALDKPRTLSPKKSLHSTKTPHRARVSLPVKKQKFVLGSHGRSAPALKTSPLP